MSADIPVGPQRDSAYRTDIEGLRAVAVMVVVLHHLWPQLVPGGFIGVDVFFVISGYLITRIIRRDMDDGRFTFIGFYERRIRRLFPALLVVLGFVLVAGWYLLPPSDYLTTFRASAGTTLFAANLMFWRDLERGYFATDAKLNPLLHMWSLGIEEQFYLLFPIVLLLIHRYARRWLAHALAAGFVLSLGLSVVMTPIKPVASFFLLPTRA
ncbi:acyltransferase [Pseudoxanthomonas sp. NC8]|nr:acyltransferase [Pseudoxanthomonas sp. NC8]